MEGSKACTKCGVVKLFSEFRKKRGACKACEKAISRARYEANREKVIARIRAWRAANRERERARNRAWLAANPEKHNAASSKYGRKMSDSVSFGYVARKLRIPVSRLTQELYILKRDQILISRALRELTKATKGLNHED